MNAHSPKNALEPSFKYKHFSYTIPVYTHRAEGSAPFKVVFVMHGVRRDARRALRNFASQYKGSQGVLFVSPELSDRALSYPAALSLGNMKKDSHVNSKLNAPEDWLFSVVDGIMRIITEKNVDIYEPKYSIFGHSAGAQFVHRMVLFGNTTNLDKAISANAGWYTTIDPTLRFPYGIGECTPKINLEKALASNLFILLGDKDVMDENLRQTNNARKQGKTRFERGNNFYHQAMNFAKDHGIKSNWTIVHEPGVGHDSRRMARSTLKILFK